MLVDWIIGEYNLRKTANCFAHAPGLVRPSYHEIACFLACLVPGRPAGHAVETCHLGHAW
jgi:hypothetical protein